MSVIVTEVVKILCFFFTSSRVKLSNYCTDLILIRLYQKLRVIPQFGCWSEREPVSHVGPLHCHLSSVKSHETPHIFLILGHTKPKWWAHCPFYLDDSDSKTRIENGRNIFTDNVRNFNFFFCQK